jgi:hypothetical protein
MRQSDTVAHRRPSNRWGQVVCTVTSRCHNFWVHVPMTCFICHGDRHCMLGHRSSIERLPHSPGLHCTDLPQLCRE